MAENMTLLVTGAAGFIGFHTARALLERGDRVVGYDNLNAYYDPALKAARLALLERHPRFRFERGELADSGALAALCGRERCTRVVHLAAQAGVRHSIDHPHAYIDSNITGFLNVLEACREHGVLHLVYASTSSVYGANTRLPFAESQNVDHPLSLYAATKKANELMAHSYSALHGLPTTGLRFFTVYGPWGRPDMALFRFTKNMLAGLPIDVYNEGRHQRDFTYIDDIVSGVLAAVARVATAAPAGGDRAPAPAARRAPDRGDHLGNQRPVPLLRYIEVLEECLGLEAEKRMMPMQAGDVPETWADVTRIARDLDYRPHTAIETGVRRFVEWYREYYRL